MAQASEERPTGKTEGQQWSIPLSKCGGSSYCFRAVCAAPCLYADVAEGTQAGSKRTAEWQAACWEGMCNTEKTAKTRTVLREKYGIAGSKQEDEHLHLVNFCCAIGQEAYELEKHGDTKMGVFGAQREEEEKKEKAEASGEAENPVASKA